MKVRQLVERVFAAQTEVLRHGGELKGWQVAVSPTTRDDLRLQIINEFGGSVPFSSDDHGDYVLGYPVVTDDRLRPDEVRFRIEVAA